MASPAELSLDYKPPNGYAVKQLGNQQQPEQSSSQKIQEFLVRLEEERRKIDAFKRELPLCMQLLNNAIEYYNNQQLLLQPFQTNRGPRPVLEEFMLLKHDSVEGGEKAAGAPSEKASWMISAQLWSPPPGDAAKQQAVAGPPKDADGQVFDVSPKLALDAKQRNGGSSGAFLPFSKEKNKSIRAAPRGLDPELALVSFSEKAAAAAAGEEEESCVEGENGGVKARKENGGSGAVAEHGQGVCSSANEGQAKATPPPPHRKTRRCWSPDLHRRFVNALQILGGSHVATPKQIRELMKVDGLTNDEVKSHLQKYRLHTRRPAAPPQGAAAPQLVVLGGIWVPPEYATSATAGPAIYGAHAAPAHYAAAAAVPQDHFYPPMPQPLQQQNHLLPHPPNFHRGGEAYTYREKPAGSPESEVRSGGERSTGSIEEEEERDEREEEEEDDQEEEEEDAEGEEEKAVVQVMAKAEDVNSSEALKF